MEKKNDEIDSILFLGARTFRDNFWLIVSFCIMLA